MLDMTDFNEQNFPAYSMQEHSSFHNFIFNCKINSCELNFCNYIRIIIINEPIKNKYNVYIVKDDNDSITYKNADMVVTGCQPLTLEEAIEILPDWGFTEENYGF